MKLKLHISRKSNLGPPAIIDRIMSNLKDKHYIVQTVTRNTVLFHDNPWQLLGSFQYVSRLDGGEFEISATANGIIVSFDYYRTILIQVTVFTAVVVFFLIQGPSSFVLFSILFYLIALGIQAVALTNVARDIIEDILS